MGHEGTFQRWPESYFQTPLLFQNLWIWTRIRKFFRFENPTPVQIPATTDATEIRQCFYLMTFVRITQTPATAWNEKWLRIRVRKKRRIPPESTLALRIRDHLWYFRSGTLQWWQFKAALFHERDHVCELPRSKVRPSKGQSTLRASYANSDRETNTHSEKSPSDQIVKRHLDTGWRLRHFRFHQLRPRHPGSKCVWSEAIILSKRIFADFAHLSEGIVILKKRKPWYTAVKYMCSKKQKNLPLNAANTSEIRENLRACAHDRLVFTYDHERSRRANRTDRAGFSWFPH